MNLLGGPKVAAIVHRTFASIFLAIFLVHLVYILRPHRAARARTFQWFGPNSLVPRWQDLKDIIAMFKWFFGKGPRPTFDRWTYWEKFDYWAVFWGVAIIGVSGLMLWFPDQIASFLPGWVFNVATIVHGEEAILAAVFLFTVHFFNNHFRPDKFPLDIVMFTGAVLAGGVQARARRGVQAPGRLRRAGEVPGRRAVAPDDARFQDSRLHADRHRPDPAGPGDHRLYGERGSRMSGGATE